MALLRSEWQCIKFSSSLAVASVSVSGWIIHVYDLASKAACDLASKAACDGSYTGRFIDGSV